MLHVNIHMDVTDYKDSGRCKMLNINIQVDVIG